MMGHLSDRQASSWLLRPPSAVLVLVGISNLLLALAAASASASASSTSSVCDRHRHHRQAGPFAQEHEDDHPDRVTHLPGYDQPLPTPWYSGYLNYELEGRAVHTHYLLILAEELEDEEYDDDDDGTEEDPRPLLYWSNGGPGASSLFGVLTELGPLLLSDDSLNTADYEKTGVPTPIYNPHNWARLGHLLAFDQPAPVGFSYCGDDVHTHSCGGLAWTDELATENAYLALEAFYEAHPCFESLPLFLSGESYAGVYIPSLARRIVRDAATEDIDGGDGGPISIRERLRGFAVGDGCLGTQTSVCGNLNGEGFGAYWHVLFMAGHHQIPLSDYRDVIKACHHSDSADFLIGGSRDDEECKAVLKKVHEELGGYFAYGLYDECTYRNGLLLSSTSGERTPLSAVKGALNDYACGGGPVLERYLKLGQVKDALHVESDFFEVDNAGGDFDYTPTEPDLQPFYREMMNDGRLRMLVYNGDTDPAITSFAAQNWTSHLGFKEIEHWRPWTIDGCQRMGGYVTRYEGGLDFVTIRGAGHMVPTNKPEATFIFMKTWLSLSLSGEEEEGGYPLYDKNCTIPPSSSSTEQLRSQQQQLQEIDGKGGSSSEREEVETVAASMMLRG